jgi:hypothetical protein
VSVSRADRLSLLVTYTVEVGSLLRDVFALCLYPDGSVMERPLWLPEHAVTEDDSWGRHFVDWAPDAITAAGLAASVIAKRIVAAFAAGYRDRIVRDIAVARVWLGRRADELCGAAVPRTGDLFEIGPSPGDWRSCPVPEQRLSGFAADPLVGSSQRRGAADVLARYRLVTADQSPLPPPSVRRLGFLMLVP